ncbi:MAG: hypothetical protein SCK57_03220 [Bacillota bacterium]|nr:hypothetical protein [Bacillota bacterium]MDW7676648.1 hypothetical protein [Bacillota bacterium]
MAMMVTKDEKLDYLMYTVCALGEKKSLHKYIDKIYKKDSSLYYKAYRSDAYYNHPYINTLLTKKGYYSKKVIGIMNVALLSEDMSNINYLIQKGYKLSWNYIKNRGRIEGSKFMDMVMEKYGDDTNIGFHEAVNHMVVLAFLCSVNKIPLYFDEENFQIFSDYIENNYKVAVLGRIMYNEKSVEKVRDKVDAFNNTYPTTKPIKSVGDFFDEMVDWESRKVREEYPCLDDPDVIQKKVIKHPWSSAGLRLIRFLGGEGVDGENLIHETPFSKKELEEVVAHAFHCIKDYRLKDEEVETLVLTSLFIRALVTEYKNTKHMYFEELSESYQEEIEEIRKVTETIKIQAKNAEAELVKKEGRYQKTIDKQNETLSELEKENKRLKEALTQQEDNRKELHALREFMFSMESDSSPEYQNVSLEEKIALVESYKCAVLGGHPNWVKKAKETLPGYVFISPDQKTVDFNFLDNMDAVFINTSYNSHTIYEKAMNFLRSNDVPLFYINEAGSLDKAVDILYRDLNVIKSGK